MLRFLLAAGLLLPHFGFAQLVGSNAFRDGSYVLAASRLIRYAGQPKPQDGATLVVKNPDGKSLKLPPAEVASCRLGSQRYVPADGFHVAAGLGGIDAEAVFAKPPFMGQFNHFEVGSYVLRNQLDIRHYGQIKLRNGRKLVIKTIAGKTRRVKAPEVLSYSIGQRRYSVVSQLLFYSGSHLVSEQAAYAQVLDSGKVVLLRYDYLLNTGIDWLFLYRYPTSVYLVRDQPDSTFVAIGDTFDKVYFQQHVRQFLVTRADLVNALDAGRITYQNFPSAIHALNQNLPFYPLAVPESKE